MKKPTTTSAESIMRLEALRQANESAGRDGSALVTVKRAEAYLKFLQGK